VTGWVFDRVPLNANRLARRNGWKVRMWEKAAWVKLIKEVAGFGPWAAENLYGKGLDAIGWEPTTKERVRIAITMNRSRVQDPDNRIGCLKPLIDALKTCGWCCDDSDHWLELHVFETKCKRGEEATWIVWDRIEAVTLRAALAPEEVRK
jgi:hypothetical protein